MASIEDVRAAESDISGWTTQTISITQTGNYTLYFGVVNASDNIASSDLWIDGVESGSEVPEPATLALLAPCSPRSFFEVAARTARTCNAAGDDSFRARREFGAGTDVPESRAV